LFETEKRQHETGQSLKLVDGKEKDEEILQSEGQRNGKAVEWIYHGPEKRALSKKKGVMETTKRERKGTPKADKKNIREAGNHRSKKQPANTAPDSIDATQERKLRKCCNATRKGSLWSQM